MGGTFPCEPLAVLPSSLTLLVEVGVGLGLVWSGWRREVVSGVSDGIALLEYKHFASEMPSVSYRNNKGGRALMMLGVVWAFFCFSHFFSSFFLSGSICGSPLL
ncbi:unnamed protein product [Tuber aestivum]|uniref:Uncharacterized protein n=1 Tax=Tuber aestivum TaxID=59557 RepID=A0A292PQU4_9PEZI|nr:unnamed protein product [Tuber aestivum]